MRLKSTVLPLAAVLATTAVAAPAGASIPRDPGTTTTSAPPIHRATDLRSPDSVDRAQAATAAAVSQVPGPPTWPAHAKTLTRPQGAVRASAPGHGVDVPEIGLIGGGVLVLASASGAVLVARRRRSVATRIVATS